MSADQQVSRTRLPADPSSNHPVLEVWGRNARLLQGNRMLLHGGYPTPASYAAVSVENSGRDSPLEGPPNDLPEVSEVGTLGSKN